MSSSSCIKEFLDKDIYYKKKYGPKTFLIYEVGSFFEVYGLEDDPSFKNIKLYSEICDLNIGPKKVSIRNKQVYMAGYQSYLLEKYIEKIHPRGYTIVVYTQQGENADGTKIRKLHDTYSPGTTFLDHHESTSNNMSCIWIQRVKTLYQERYIFGLSNVNLMTGHSDLCEYDELFYHNPTTYDSIESFLNIYNPNEFVLIHNADPHMIEEVIQYMNVNSKKHYIIDLNDREHMLSEQARAVESQLYQDEIILSFFPKTNLSVFKYDICEKPIALQSYCFLLNFIHQHNVSLVEKIHEPRIHQINEALVCANHSLKQLNIISDDVNNSYFDDGYKVKSVLALINICKTKMGKRHMNEVFLNPINNAKKLQKQYDMIDHFIKRDFNFADLSKICDMDKIMTKLKLQKITPCDIYQIIQSHDILEHLLKQVKSKKDANVYEEFNINQARSQWKEFYQYIHKIFDLNSCACINTLSFDKFEQYNDSLFQRGVSAELDTSIQKKQESKDQLHAILAILETYFTKKESDGNYIAQHQPSSSELCLLITKKRSKALKDRLMKETNQLMLEFVSSFNNQSKNFLFDLSSIYFKDYNKNKVLLCCPLIDQLISNIYQENMAFQDLLQSTYKEVISEIYDTYFQHLVDVVYVIKYMDIFYTKMILAKQYNLCKPEMIEKDHSFVRAKNMRHLLVEMVENKETYVPNDIHLGEDEHQQGVLLYGTNAVGKTCLIKALGINIILAQSGFYVPCESFVYCPYKYIFTRIIGNDNLFKGLSTFGVEMSELRVILQHCDKRSLILGDELCSGTEIDSALSIFISSLEIMTQRQSSFIFATHFHELQTMEAMKALNCIQSKHLKVQYDHEKQTLYYDRKIHDGPGDSVYGLEVCKSLKLPSEFMDRCYEIRNDRMKNKSNVLLMKRSKYNKDKLRHLCEFCENELATETHHLKYQKDAIHNEYIENSFHKNHSANLASICEHCHNFIHLNHLVYEKRKTMDGNYELILKKN